MAKIAVELAQALTRRAVTGEAGRTTPRRLAQGEGWAVEDVICTSGPGDRPFEERHAGVLIVIVASGSFQYRAATGRELMAPGSLLLGNAGQSFECSHEHGCGDRCIAFHYAPDYFESLAADACASGSGSRFRVPRLPLLRELSTLVAQACAALSSSGDPVAPWGELSVRLAARAVQLAGDLSARSNNAPPSALARVTRAVRTIERHLDNGLTLETLARESGLSPYHFLRTFERLTGLTPHQYILRARLREAASLLAHTGHRARILDIALDSGFGDVSNFNRAFRAEFGASPRAYRLQAAG